MERNTELLHRECILDRKIAPRRGNKAWASKPKDVGRSCVLGSASAGSVPQGQATQGGYEQC